MHCRAILAFIICILSAPSAINVANGQGASFSGLGSLGEESRPSAISANGSTVVGTSQPGSGAFWAEAFVWTSSTGMRCLGTLGGWFSSAYGVSSNGDFVVGLAENATGTQEAFIWTETGGMVGLGILPGFAASEAYGVSVDGSVVVGVCRDYESGARTAFIWSQATGMQVLDGSFEGNSAAYAVSSDGQTVAGNFGSSLGSDAEAFIWTSSTGLVGLGKPSGGNSYVEGLTANGSIVFGETVDSLGQLEAFAWTAASGMLALGSANGFNTWASGSSNDGAVIVGSGYEDGGDYSALLWRDGDGGQLLQDVLTDEFGLDLTGWILNYAYISANGDFLTGAGTNPNGVVEAWIAVLPTEEPATAAMLGDLIELSEDFIDYPSLKNALVATLENALKAIVAGNAGQRQDAVHKIEAYVHKVEAQRGKKISEDDANVLIEAAQIIIDRLEE